MPKSQGAIVGETIMFDVNSVKYPEELSCFGKIKDSEYGTHEECPTCRWWWKCRYYYNDERF